jgi:hypothetical protein
MNDKFSTMKISWIHLLPLVACVPATPKCFAADGSAMSCGERALPLPDPLIGDHLVPIPGVPEGTKSGDIVRKPGNTMATQTVSSFEEIPSGFNVKLENGTMIVKGGKQKEHHLFKRGTNEDNQAHAKTCGYWTT